jgi:hypothetical protein
LNSQIASQFGAKVPTSGAASYAVEMGQHEGASMPIRKTPDLTDVCGFAPRAYEYG